MKLPPPQKKKMFFTFSHSVKKISIFFAQQNIVFEEVGGNDFKKIYTEGRLTLSEGYPVLQRYASNHNLIYYIHCLFMLVLIFSQLFLKKEIRGTTLHRHN